MRDHGYRPPTLWIKRGGKRYHSTRSCPRFGAPLGNTITLEEAWEYDIPPCWVCCPRTIYVIPDAAPPSVYHAKPTCTALPDGYHGHPDWLDPVQWPTAEYDIVRHADGFKRCSECIPSRHVLYSRAERRKRRRSRDKRAA